MYLYRNMHIIYISKKEAPDSFLGVSFKKPMKKRGNESSENQSHPFSGKMLVFRFGRQERPRLGVRDFSSFLGRAISLKKYRSSHVCFPVAGYAKRQCFLGICHLLSSWSKPLPSLKLNSTVRPWKWAFGKGPRINFQGRKCSVQGWSFKRIVPSITIYSFRVTLGVWKCQEGTRQTIINLVATTDSLPETNSSSPLKLGFRLQKKRNVFQPSIFRCKLAVSFKECIPPPKEKQLGVKVVFHQWVSM